MDASCLKTPRVRDTRVTSAALASRGSPTATHQWLPQGLANRDAGQRVFPPRLILRRCQMAPSPCLHVPQALGLHYALRASFHTAAPPAVPCHKLLSLDTPSFPFWNLQYIKSLLINSLFIRAFCFLYSDALTSQAWRTLEGLPLPGSANS